MNNRKLIHALSDSLNRMKGFEAGSTSGNANQMLISFDNKTYKINIQKVEDSELSLDLVEKHL